MQSKFCSKMMVWRIKKLGKNAKIYLVLRNEEEPGFRSYSDDYIARIDVNKYEEVLAREPMETAYRYMRRKNALLKLVRYDFTPDQTDKTYAKLRVLPKDNFHEEYATYWR